MLSFQATFLTNSRYLMSVGKTIIAISIVFMSFTSMHPFRPVANLINQDPGKTKEEILRDSFFCSMVEFYYFLCTQNCVNHSWDNDNGKQLGHKYLEYNSWISKLCSTIYKKTAFSTLYRGQSYVQHHIFKRSNTATNTLLHLKNAATKNTLMFGLKKSFTCNKLIKLPALFSASWDVSSCDGLIDVNNPKHL